ncbi:zinc finger CCHC domain-containing protein 9-like [Drosophila gunungcola]|uniref:zinc finger CCHC domain-containing protein 9-like n=1 Tax=Drosophila gunungcola TaxID=103775 RepID=UPI0022E8630A|nr:zinc finger CCHC domain-containing protein 9-like [Drosophila gunungcola]
MYFEDKKMMSQAINMDTEELLEQLIEGIPSASFRDQARIQRFANPEQMLLAFANIRLSQQPGTYAPKKSTLEATQINNLRCRNCNSKGHFAKECRKPARAPGSCFACGELGHIVGECRQRKRNTYNNSNSNNNSSDNNYNVS